MYNYAVLPRMIAHLFHDYPDTKDNQAVLSHLNDIRFAFQWADQHAIDAMVRDLRDAQSSLDNYAFSVLFEGQGVMEAPPWASVYQNVENLVMGDSTGDFKRFLEQEELVFHKSNQPCDHISIMLWSLAAFTESYNDRALEELLRDHLLTWVYRYLELLDENSTSEFYSILAKICRLFLQQIQVELNITPKRVRLYR